MRYFKISHRLLLLVLLGTGYANAATSDLHRALQDELARNMEELHIEGLPKPYFISYTVHTDHSINLSASGGGIESQNLGRSRTLQVQMRVGSHELDNTNFVSTQTRNIEASTLLTLEDDYGLLRKQIWLATDRAYKQASEVFATKVAALQNTTPQERVPDFSKESPFVYTDEKRSREIDPQTIRKVARDLSKLGNSSEFLYDNRVAVFANQHTDTYFNSEGSHFTRIDDTAFLRVGAWTQADDGRYITDHVAIAGRVWRDVLNLASAKKQVKAMYERMNALTGAETLERYNGPLLLRDQAAAELVAQSLAPNFLSIKQPVFPSNNFAASFNQMFEGRSFKNKLGARVLPRGWNVYDDPTIDTYNGVQLIGQYPIDSDGIPTKRVNLVEKGILQTMLTDRNPTEDIRQSTGSNATSSGPTVSNLIIEGSGGQSEQELNQTFMELVSELGLEFGIRVDYVPTPTVTYIGIPSPFSGFRYGNALPTTLAYKVYSNGTEELIRNAVIAMPLVSELRNLAGYSNKQYVHSGMYSYRSGDVSKLGASFPVYVSVATPNLLFEDVTIINQEGIVRTKPVVQHPRASN